MNERIIHLRPGEGRTMLVGGGDMLFFHQPAGLEEFFEEWGIPVSRVGEVPDGLEAPDLAAMGAALERNGIHVVGGPQPVA